MTGVDLIFLSLSFSLSPQSVDSDSSVLNYWLLIAQTHAIGKLQVAVFRGR